MKEFLNTPLGGWMKIFVAAVLFKFYENGADIFTLDLEHFKSLVTVGVFAIIPIIINYLNPLDKRYGFEEKEADNG